VLPGRDCSPPSSSCSPRRCWPRPAGGGGADRVRPPAGWRLRCLREPAEHADAAPGPRGGRRAGRTGDPRAPADRGAWAGRAAMGGPRRQPPPFGPAATAGSARLVPQYGLLAAVALHAALAGTGVPLKWPNDLVRDGAKLAGVLCRGDARRPRHRPPRRGLWRQSRSCA
jgi:hypothetical protein